MPSKNPKDLIEPAHGWYKCFVPTLCQGAYLSRLSDPKILTHPLPYSLTTPSLNVWWASYFFSGELHIAGVLSYGTKATFLLVWSLSCLVRPSTTYILTPVQFSRHDCWCGPCWLYINSLENIKQTFDQGQWLARNIWGKENNFVTKVLIKRSYPAPLADCPNDGFLVAAAFTPPPFQTALSQAKLGSMRPNLASKPPRTNSRKVLWCFFLGWKSAASLRYGLMAGNWKTLLT